MKRITTACLLCFCLCFVVVGSSVVFAQETTPEPVVETQTQTTPSDSTILERTSLSKDIVDLTATYKGQLEEYRQVERDFTVAREQYRKLNTLISLEEGVKSTRTVMLARSRVLTTYLRLLRLQLVEANGIAITSKTEALAEIDALLVVLADHTQAVQSIADKNDVVTVADAFVEHTARIENSAYHVMSLLAIGKMQVVYDKVDALSVQMKKDAANSISPLKQAEKDRAFEETLTVMNEAKAGLQELSSTTKLVTRGTRSNGNLYAIALKELGQTYAQLSQTINYMRELTRI
jgi:hypothetical protein